MDLDIKYWRSALIKDGLGPFLNPAKLKDKVRQISTRVGLSEQFEPEALGLLMDTTEMYMKEFVRKVIQKARIRT
jgi:hypothetical protein